MIRRYLITTQSLRVLENQPRRHFSHGLELLRDTDSDSRSLPWVARLHPGIHVRALSFHLKLGLLCLTGKVWQM